MNRRRYFEIEEDQSLSKEEKELLHRIEDKNEVIDFWKGKIGYAEINIKKNEEKISKLKEKLDRKKGESK